MRAIEVARAVADLALPSRCGGCDAPGHAVCPGCAAAVLEWRGRRPFPAVPTPCPPGMPRTWAVAAYEGPVAAMLRAYKDDGRADLRAPLAALLRDSVAAAIAGVAHDVPRGAGLVVVPVPSSGRARRRRGREPLTDLTREALRDGRVAVAATALRVRRVHDQAGLSAGERARNLGGAMRLRHGIRLEGAICVVVDDIVTTGATLAEAARVLSAAGARDVVAATVAATRRRDAGPAGAG